MNSKMEKKSSIYIAGHTGLVGSAILRRLQQEEYSNLIFQNEQELDLTDHTATENFFAQHKPEYVVLAAAKVGGIQANNTYPADFIRVNLQIQTNVIDAAYRHGVKKLLFLGSSCIYPKFAPQPINEDHLLSGKLEPTNDAYAIAKIAGLIMIKSYNRQYGTNFIGAMPTNLYGPNDNFDINNSHVIPAMIRKFHEAKMMQRAVVELWGSGTPRREFLFVDDLADGLLFLLNHFNASKQNPEECFVNIGVGEDLTIKELAEMVQQEVRFEGKIVWNRDMPDGTPRKLLDVSRITELGWTAPTPLREGIRQTYRWYFEQGY